MLHKLQVELIIINIQVGDRVGIMRDDRGRVRIFYNGRDLGVVARDMTVATWAIVDVHGKVNKVTISGAYMKLQCLIFLSLNTIP